MRVTRIKIIIPSKYKNNNNNDKLNETKDWELFCYFSVGWMPCHAIHGEPFKNNNNNIIRLYSDYFK